MPVSKQAVTVRRVDTYTDNRPGGEQAGWSSQPPPYRALWGRGTTGFTNPTEEKKDKKTPTPVARAISASRLRRTTAWAIASRAPGHEGVTLHPLAETGSP